LPVLKVCFPDGTEQPYWNTLSANNIQSDYKADLQNIKGLTKSKARLLFRKLIMLLLNQDLTIDEDLTIFKADILQVVEQKRI
jgi:sucrose phosphorylase